MNPETYEILMTPFSQTCQTGMKCCHICEKEDCGDNDNPLVAKIKKLEKRYNLVYVTTMYRWADREKHSYVLGVYDSEELARKNAEEEETDRGGKYSAEILMYKMNEGNTITRKLIKELEK